MCKIIISPQVRSDIYLFPHLYRPNKQNAAVKQKLVEKKKNVAKDFSKYPPLKKKKKKILQKINSASIEEKKNCDF